jgi:ATP-dependent RNA helicase DeaD
MKLPRASPTSPSASARCRSRKAAAAGRWRRHRRRRAAVRRATSTSPPASPANARTDGALVRYRIEVGRNQGASPKEIVGAIANEGGIEGKYIGQIHLFNDFSTVELPANLPSDLLDTLKRTRVRQLPLNIRALTDAEAVAVPERRRPPREDGPRREDALRRSEAPRRDDAPRQYGDERRPPRSYGADSGKPAWGDKGAGQGKPGRDEHKPYPQRHDDRAGNAPFSAHKPKRPKDA